jgi:molybdopterin-guanine dinucleotide biosynthesis protein A
MIEPIDQNLCFDGFVLVGGASSRMGQDKAQMVLDGKKFFERAAIVLGEISCGRLSLVGRQSAQLSTDSELDLDAFPDLRIAGEVLHRAPIAGLYTALINARAPWIAVLACDLPFVTGDLMTKLASFCSDDFDAVVPIQQDTRPQPLCALYRREKCLVVVEEMLKTGDLKLQRFLSRISPRYVDFAEIAGLIGSANFFLNINRRDDYETALRIATR